MITDFKYCFFSYVSQILSTKQCPNTNTNDQTIKINPEKINLQKIITKYKSLNITSTKNSWPTTPTTKYQN